MGAAGLIGCAREAPIVSRGSRTTVMTLDEQRSWVAGQLDLAVRASGVSDGWYDSFDEALLWSAGSTADRERLLNSLLPRGCDGFAGRLSVTLINNDAPDPFAAAGRVRAFWESEGWKVTDIRSYSAGKEPYFRADREGGAELALEAAEGGIALEVASACSAHNTVTSWERYLDESSEP
ncbi:hypothetical protein D1J51_11490 [Leucobacter sp. wl10]|nr:hypothetical protein D1J51_11490 [Leucobacter sp. wl10]